MKPIRNIAVLGLGTMGHGIVQAFAAAGFRVRGFDALKSARDSLPGRIRRNMEEFVAAGLATKSEVAPVLARITICASEVEAVRGAHFVTEAVREDLRVKQDLFARIEGFVAPDAILASNSSTYPISRSAARMRRPERAIVTHWFNPPHIVPVVEVVPGRRTSAGVTRATLALMKKIGKEAVRIDRELPGFIVNRVQVAVMREVWNLLDRGVATPEAIDAAIRGTMGFRLAAIGPLEVNDFGGLDVHTSVFRNLVGEICSGTRLPGLIGRLVKAGHFGTKTLRGIYRYTTASLAAKRSRRDRCFLDLLKTLHTDNPKATAR